MEHPPRKFIRHDEKITLSIISAPFNGGQPRVGTELGPESLLEPEFMEGLASLNLEVAVHADLGLGTLQTNEDVIFGNTKNSKLVGEATRRVYEAVHAHSVQNHTSLILGGDHSLAIGTISATAQRYGPNLGVIWIDAHADINTPTSSESGNMHGMPVAFLMGLPGTDNVPGFEWLYKLRQPAVMNDVFPDILPFASIRPGRIVYVGLRDLDEPEKEILKRYNILAFSMHEVDHYGIAVVMEKAMAYLGSDHPIHLSFDVDGLDPSVSPSTGTPVMGGLSFREGRYLCEVIAKSGQLIAMDLMEVNPALGACGSHKHDALDGEVGKAALHQAAVHTIRVARAIVYAAFGRQLL